MPNRSDSFLERHYPASPQPPRVSLTLRKGERLALIGDSITEANRYSRMVETYLAVCAPDQDVEVRNLGKGGETAAGFLDRISDDCLQYQPTVATICYGMNDAGYMDDDLASATAYRAAIERIIALLRSGGVRTVLASPGCIGRLPPWEFVREANSTLEGINATLLRIRDAAAEVAAAERIPFVDHFWGLYQARVLAARYGPEYAVCGADDGVHPSWAGHTVMAFGLLSAFGFHGDLGSFNIDLDTRTATADGDHAVAGEADGAYAFVSRRYPFCAEGQLDRDWFIRSGMTLVPFYERLNRMTLRVSGVGAGRYRVAWTNGQNLLDEWHTYSGTELLAGINLADEFQRTPFSDVFRRIDDLVFQKQGVESCITWLESEAGGTSAGARLAEYEAQRVQLLSDIARARIPVTHHIRIEAEA